MLQGLIIIGYNESENNFRKLLKPIFSNARIIVSRNGYLMAGTYRMISLMSSLRDVSWFFKQPA